MLLEPGKLGVVGRTIQIVRESMDSWQPFFLAPARRTEPALLKRTLEVRLLSVALAGRMGPPTPHKLSVLQVQFLALLPSVQRV